MYQQYTDGFTNYYADMPGLHTTASSSSSGNPYALAGISAAGDIIGGGISAYYSYKNAKEARRWQEKMWRLQNAYQSPSAYMQRLREANLNPNLALGGVSSSSASVPGSPAIPQAPDLSHLGSNTLGSYSQAVALRRQEADIKSVQQRTQLDRMRALTEFKRMYLLGQQGRAARQRADQFDRLMSQLDSIISNKATLSSWVLNEYNPARIRLMDSQTDLNVSRKKVSDDDHVLRSWRNDYFVSRNIDPSYRGTELLISTLASILHPEGAGGIVSQFGNGLGAASDALFDGSAWTGMIRNNPFEAETLPMYLIRKYYDRKNRKNRYRNH